MTNKGIFIFFTLIISFTSCGTGEKREDMLVKYFVELGIQETAYVALLNPDYCGSCTDFSIDFLEKNKTRFKNKVILNTSELNQTFSQRLKKVGYKFVKGDEKTLARMGVTLSACTIVLMENGKINEIKTLK